MTNVKKNERYIPTKNYVIAAVIVIGIILLTWYGFSWYKIIKENKVSTSYLISEKIISNELNGLEEVADVFSEVPNSYYVYISYTGDEEIYKMEEELSSLIKDYHLADNFYFFNVSSFKDDKDCIDKINEVFNLEDNKVTSIPTIIYFKDGKASNIIKNEGRGIMSVGEFQKMLDINGVTKE
ncbi:MAG TPA: hypothetical protein DCE23_06460 [Firmicutes bacterium]|nr:hypothetical protein [Bacillota bacterium]